MAHKVFLPDEKDKSKKKFKFIPEGKVGFSVYLGSKEVFVGITIANVIQETITRSRKIKTTPGTVQIYPFDQ